MIVVFVTLIMFCLASQAFFTMMEMAIVSIDRIRLEYRVQEGDGRAQIIKSLLEKPSFLFTTTLIGVNTFLQIGSECARLLFFHLSMNPNYSPLAQIFIVLLFAELIPLMIARQHADTIALKGAKLVNGVKIMLTPMLWFMHKISSVLEGFFHKDTHSPFSLSRKELELVIAQKGRSSSLDLATLMKNLSSLQAQSLTQLMIPIKKMPLFAYETDLNALKKSLMKDYHPFVLIYLQEKSSIIGLVFARDLLDQEDTSLSKVMHPAWFVTESTPIKMLKLFRQNKQKMAIVLNKKGQSQGILTLDTLISEILMNTHQEPIVINKVVDKHVCLDTRISTINEQYDLSLPFNKGDKVSHLFSKLQENPLDIGHVRLTKKEGRVHIQTLNA